jgi:hypothetical protein
MQTEKNRAIQKFYYLKSGLGRIDAWGPGDERLIEANIISETYISLGDELLADCPNTDELFPPSWDKDQIPYELWIVRQALHDLAPEYNGMFRKWYEAPDRTKFEILKLLSIAFDVAKAKIYEIPDLFDEGADRETLVLHRYVDADGSQLCAMSALSKMLGYEPLTCNPDEVDPGLTALITLLNDRANERARQLLLWRLEYVPNTGRTKICNLIAKVFFPEAIFENGFEEEASEVYRCKGVRELTRIYASLGKRFLKPDGVGYLANGCITLSAALKSRDPIAKDILAISAASEVVSFETGEGWFDLLYILDYVLGLEDSPSSGGLQKLGDFYKYFGEDIISSSDEERPKLEPF